MVSGKHRPPVFFDLHVSKTYVKECARDASGRPAVVSQDSGSGCHTNNVLAGKAVLSPTLVQDSSSIKSPCVDV